jgi:bacteriophage N4 adsorption protein B
VGADVFETYLVALKIAIVVLACVILVSGLDDLLVDTLYWVRRAWRRLVVYTRHERLDPRALLAPAEQPLAIMVPAWHETGVIGRMAALAATTLDYENYHVFVGTYPNDLDMQRDVDEVCARFPNIHKVVCARPGPTSKSDCLNNVLDAILQFERRANLEFAGFVLHDAEDVVSPLELRLFNYLVDRKDLIQLPVYPYPRRWFDFTSGHYMDEFAEIHGKDILVREAVAGQVPSAGVGTCFSRRAITALLADGDGLAFDIQSLTEDYDIGIRLSTKGMREIFVRFPEGAAGPPGRAGAAGRDAPVVCVREYFPNTLSAAVRQKARWVVGIVYQGFRTHGWSGDLRLNYFLWRDRKGIVSNFVGFAATIVFLQLVVLRALEPMVPGSGHVRELIAGDAWLLTLLGVNLSLMVNRVAHRVYFSTRYYGLREGLLAIPRLFWGQVINFLANWRALVQIVRHGDPRRVAWDKTMHDFPVLGEAARARRPLGQILVAQGAITKTQLEEALLRPVRGLKLGSSLVHLGLISSPQLAAAVAEQSGVPWEPIHLPAVEEEAWRLTAEIALRYAIVPVRDAAGTLVVASESTIDPVSLAALARKVGSPVSYVIAPKGEVTVALRQIYAPRREPSPKLLLDRAVAGGRLTTAHAGVIWERFVSRQVLFAEVLMSLGHLELSAFRAVLLRHAGQAARLGEYLVQQGVVTGAVLREGLEVQRELQGTIESLMEEAGIEPVPVAAGPRGAQ